MDSSFKDSEREDDMVVTVWSDINTQSTTKNNASNASSTNRYVSNGINGLPAVSFNTMTGLTLSDDTLINKSDYTIFVVDKRKNNTNQNFLFTQ